MTPPLNWEEMYRMILHNEIDAKKISLTHNEVRFLIVGYGTDVNGELTFIVNPDLWVKVTTEIQNELKSIWDGDL